MDNKNWLVLGLTILVIGLGAYYFSPAGKFEKKSAKKGDIDETVFFKDFTGYSDTIYPDAPIPFQDNAEAEEEAINLWPSTLKSRKDDAHREKVKEEWRDFASKYPKNVYILNEFKSPLSAKETEEITKTLDSYTSVNTFFAKEASKNRYGGQPGVDPQIPKDPTVTPDQQKTFFSYKIREMESRLELLEYTKQQNGLETNQEKTAEKDIAKWKKELEQLKTISASVPNS